MQKTIDLALILMCFFVAWGFVHKETPPTEEEEEVTAIGPQNKPVIMRPAARLSMRYLGDAANKREAEYLIQSPAALRAQVERYSFAIENISPHSVVLLSVSYHFARAGEESPKFGSLRHSAIGAYLIPKSNIKIIAPKGKIGFCLAVGLRDDLAPVGTGVQTVDAARTEEMREKVTEMLRSRLDQFDRSLSESEQLEVEIEGAVFDDGVFAGSNRHRSLEYANAQLAGARKFADALAPLQRKGLSYGELQAAAHNHKEDFQELIKPFPGGLSQAMDSEAFAFASSKDQIARRFVLIPQSAGLNLLRHGQEKWKPLKRLD